MWPMPAPLKSVQNMTFVRKAIPLYGKVLILLYFHTDVSSGYYESWCIFRAILNDHDERQKTCTIYLPNLYDLHNSLSKGIPPLYEWLYTLPLSLYWSCLTSRSPHTYAYHIRTYAGARTLLLLQLIHTNVYVISTIVIHSLSPIPKY